ncbi:N-methyl-L-tryptophan oxidase [Candidatus Uabimicrobium amorphum]|uniref:N-methyl-L-tryptophan oxidase n=1 Tax=Uabimicrobium amorphum TaxID=2596890 RepID=A0A5S9ISC7_UABAM|nr:N-methyl-L-tryptophan oxidase [Candidatus Uabimicrobium amorphum]BBM87258.1 N-methyl-L-tryptophan oxidase [Candidatus Uabimicrobium amorphum]
MRNFDIAIIGAGALGTACAYQLSKDGHQVVLFDQFAPPHTKGSSHGGTRLFRQAYFEDERYIPFLKEAYQLWKHWEHEFQQKLLHENGYLTIFDSTSDIAQKMHNNAQKWNITGTEFDSQQLKETFPQFQNTDGYCAYLEKQAGMLDVMTIFEQCQEHFKKQGGTTSFDNKVIGWKQQDNSYVISTQQGQFHCAKIIVANGAWLTKMPEICDMKLTIKRGVQFWYDPPQDFPSGQMPCFAFALGKDYVFGFPPFAKQGIKIASYHPRDEIHNIDQPRTAYTPQELNDVDKVARQFFPWLTKSPQEFHVCMYTLTTDEDFILDYAPQDRNTLILGGGSGHAFKFMPFLAKQISQFFPQGNPIPEELRFFGHR